MARAWACVPAKRGGKILKAKSLARLSETKSLVDELAEYVKDEQAKVFRCYGISIKFRMAGYSNKVTIPEGQWEKFFKHIELFIRSMEDELVENGVELESEEKQK